MDAVAEAAFRGLCRAQGVVDLYKGDCRGCGECCSRFLPLSAFDVERLRGYASRNAIEVRPEPEGSIDLTCPFLTEGRECSVYEARPEICRSYRCDEHARGEARVPAFYEGMRVVDMREVARDVRG